MYGICTYIGIILDYFRGQFFGKYSSTMDPLGIYHSPFFVGRSLLKMACPPQRGSAGSNQRAPWLEFLLHLVGSFSHLRNLYLSGVIYGESMVNLWLIMVNNGESMVNNG